MKGFFIWPVMLGMSLVAGVSISSCKKEVADIAVDVPVADWNEGGDVSLVPDSGDRLGIDLSRTVLPPDVEVSEDGTMIVLPHLETDFVFAVDSRDMLELVPSSAYLLEVLPENSGVRASGQDGMNMFRVRKGLYAPGVPRVYAQHGRTGCRPFTEHGAQRRQPHPVADVFSYEFNAGNL